MVIFAAFFTLGVWLLQQQAELPDFTWVWSLPGFFVALFFRVDASSMRYFRPLVIAIFAFVLGFYHSSWQAEQRLAISLSDEWQGRNIEVVGVVAELPRMHEYGQRFRFDVEQVLTSDAEVPHRLYISTYRSKWNRDSSVPVVQAGERWQFTLRLKQPHSGSNPHGFDFEYWALENDIRATGYVYNKGENIRLDDLADGVGYRIETWREAIRNKFQVTLEDTPYAGVLSALAIGDQASISAEQWQVFTRTGVNHLMSISGLHITMLASLGFAITYWLWRRSVYLTLRLPARKAAALVALLFAIGYALLSGYGVPAQRTVYMVGAVAVALWINRNFSLGQILSIALLGVLIPDPWAVLSPGFWLSFGAVALIMYVTAYRIGRPHWLAQYVKVQWAMTIGLTPLLLGLFQQVSLVSPIANAIAIPLVSMVVVPLTLLGAILPLDAVLWLAYWVMSLVMWYIEWLSALPQAVWMQHAPSSWSIIAGVFGAILILAPRGFPARWLGVLLMMPMFTNTPEPPAYGSVKLTIFDVGQGLSVAVQTQAHGLLYDTGPDFSGEADSGNRILIPALKAFGISHLDGLIITHDDIDHTGGASSILKTMPVGWVSSSLKDNHPLLNSVEDKRNCLDGESWEWDGVKFEFLHSMVDEATSKKTRDNNLGCVLRISTGENHILLTADIEKQVEQRLLAEHVSKLEADLLVVPHHGSKSSSSDSFVTAVNPDYAVFTVGNRNRYGHPKDEVVQRYADIGAEILRSDQDGAILVDMDEQGLQIERYRKTHWRYWTHTP
ncbi:MAG: DNA internalization-related competence protein ComEC/Rec2 [Gallionella sp.]